MCVKPESSPTPAVETETKRFRRVNPTGSPNRKFPKTRLCGQFEDYFRVVGDPPETTIQGALASLRRSATQVLPVVQVIPPHTEGAHFQVELYRLAGFNLLVSRARDIEFVGTGLWPP
jgi:hypothetical protein